MEVVHLLLQHGANAAVAHHAAVAACDDQVVAVLSSVDPGLMPAWRATELEVAILSVVQQVSDP
jgi:hypothetical protein